jgi:phage/plasmid-like protein (TIGR03299 family)
MAHELEINKEGKANMFSVKETPWHKLGVVLDSPPSIIEGIKQAGLNWKVELQPLQTNTGLKVEHKAVVRSSDNSILGVVGTKYTPLQNTEAFEWFQPFIDSGLVTLETAGSLHNGRKVWVMVKIKGELEVVKNDIVNKYILLSNSHDGSNAISAGFTPVRVVCNNTLTAANVHGKSKQLKIRHTQSAKYTLEMVRDTMNLVNQSFEATAEQFQYLAKHIVTKQQVIDYVKLIFGDTGSTRNTNQLDRVVWLWENGQGAQLPGVRGTAWAMYNATTEYITHESSKSVDTRLRSAWYGQNSTRNALALKEAIKMVA